MSNQTFTTEPTYEIKATAITRQQNPSNVEYTFAALDSFHTPNEHFYVRSHFKLPEIDLATYCVSIEGEVKTPVQLSLQDVRKMRPITRSATLECAGNGRVFLIPQVSGAQWELGAVSNAQWTGVPLADVLALAGLKLSAVEIIFEGADHGHAQEKPTPPGEIHYAHSIPLAKIPNALLAYEMNGQPLTPSHGFPLRVVIPGWYGMASVKWVTRIIASNVDFRGYFRTVDYAYWSQLAGHPVRIPIEEMSVKAQIARPTKNEIVRRNTDYPVTGAAWTGESEVVKVEVSTDGGQTYAEAKLLGASEKYAWRLWEYIWHTPDIAGPVTLFARATDARGRIQPVKRNESHGTYIINHILPAEVLVG